MGKERIGYRFLYDAVGCSLAGTDEYYLEFAVGEYLRAGVYLGPKPKYGIHVTTASNRYLVLGEQVVWNFNYQRDASASSYPRKFFLEVAAWKEIEVSPELSHGFYERQSDVTNQLLAFAEANKPEFIETMTLLAMVVGLRCHQQFVLDLINENPLALRPDNDFETSAHSPAARQLDTIVLNADGQSMLSRLLPEVGQASGTKRAFAARALGWLRGAWDQQDVIAQFLMLFTALEFVLGGVPGSLRPGFWEQTAEILQLIQQHAGQRAKKLEKFLNDLAGQQRPTLTSRFTDLATSAKLPGWERDVEGFKKFNKMRNDLLHQGETGVSVTVSVTEDEARHLQDLVERYVSLRLFGDAIVYPDRWLPRPSPTGPGEPSPSVEG